VTLQFITRNVAYTRELGGIRVVQR